MKERRPRNRRGDKSGKQARRQRIARDRDQRRRDYANYVAALAIFGEKPTTYDRWCQDRRYASRTVDLVTEVHRGQ